MCSNKRLPYTLLQLMLDFYGIFASLTPILYQKYLKIFFSIKRQLMLIFIKLHVHATFLNGFTSNKTTFLGYFQIYADIIRNMGSKTILNNVEVKKFLSIHFAKFWFNWASGTPLARISLYHFFYFQIALADIRNNFGNG